MARIDDLVEPPGTPLMRDPLNTRIGDLPDCDNIALLGIPWDWGITGRPGARFSPSEIRRALYSMKTYSPILGSLDCKPRDVGDVRVAPGDWSLTGVRVVEALRIAYESYRHVIVLGGDHSITEWTLKPLLEKYDRVGLILLDAHYDMRSVVEGYTSGLWLYNLYKMYGERIIASIIGVGEYSNPPYLAERAEEAGFHVLPAVDVLRDPGSIYEAIDYIEDEADAYYVSIDMDHLDQAYAPGVNAPSPLGLHPNHTLMILEEAIPALCPKGLDIVEVVPLLDRGGATVSLAGLFAARTLHLLREACGGNA